MAEPLTTVKKNGPAMERSLIDVGIKTAQELRDLGADEAYLRLLNNGVRPHFSRIMFLLWDYRGAFGMIVRDKRKETCVLGLMRLRKKQSRALAHSTLILTSIGSPRRTTA